MRAPIFHLDAFAARRFEGNPAAVMLLDRFPDDALLQQIAAENNLAETAFLVAAGERFGLRWFTPTVEVPLCGHATLASAAVILTRLEPHRETVTFETASGELTVTRAASGYAMDFPARRTKPVAPFAALESALGGAPLEVEADEHNYLVRLPDAAAVRRILPDLGTVARLDRSGLIVTATGDGPYDCVSRYFAPKKGIPEDPVTGGAHCALTPFWARRLNKTSLHAYQASRRGGELFCRLNGERVVLEGRCVFYLEGMAEI